MIAVSQAERAAVDVVYRPRFAGLEGFCGPKGVAAAQLAAPKLVDMARRRFGIAEPAAHRLAELRGSDRE